MCTNAHQHVYQLTKYSNVKWDYRKQIIKYAYIINVSSWNYKNRQSAQSLSVEKINYILKQGETMKMKKTFSILFVVTDQ